MEYNKYIGDKNMRAKYLLMMVSMMLIYKAVSFWISVLALGMVVMMAWNVLVFYFQIIAGKNEWFNKKMKESEMLLGRPMTRKEVLWGISVEDRIMIREKRKALCAS